MITVIQTILKATSWPMETPAPYSAFHIIFGALGLLCAFIAARKLSYASHPRIFFLCGVLLAGAELYKQGFLYFIVNSGHYDWWYFPFQLCSVPMYLCLLSLLFKSPAGSRAAKAAYTFIQDFSLLGGVMALLEPSGLMHPYVTLTLHGFLWHFMLVFLGLYCAMAGLGGKSLRDFLYALPIFFLCAAIAFCINVASHPYGNADMFYISPYYPNSQIVFHEIALTVGTLTGNMIYLTSVILGGFICHLALPVALKHI